MTWQLAQINVGTVLYPTDDPRLDGFMSRLDRINALAEDSPGFVWRLQSESGNATDIDVGGDPLFIVEVMKMFNKVYAPFSGTIEKVLVDTDGVIISKGQPIFKITPDEKIVVESPEEVSARRRSVTDKFLAQIA